VQSVADREAGALQPVEGQVLAERTRREREFQFG
jgi:hypothetical protein